MTEEKKSVAVSIEENKLLVKVDANKDGEPSVKLSVHLGEAIEEAVAREGSVEGVKLVDFKFELTKLILSLDTDKDGEKVLDLVIDLGESFQEVTSAFTKKA